MKFNIPIKKTVIALSLVGLMALLFPGCEKDDICPEDSATTPLLVITFHDSDDRDVREAVNTLSVYGQGMEAPVDTFRDSTSIDSIAIPLKLFENETVYAFTLNSIQINQNGDTLRVKNADTLRFRYQTEQHFISRACGFITNYSGLTAERDTDDSQQWISSLEIVNPTIQYQNTAHVKIYH
ncbi:DUF6452 family protein [Sinomicrobium soli]|uniref:DUF6452 family protein n=1 Tax=Sinomicrobium sp. N-1-3-6 TaxID=2219864 RepID=UPI000DCBDCAF|nr:DUF6452 family protein [Sinomicrobium sp. N-1-3-6]RAV29620.1 hypothetical protein DN748_05730 [Sinomicrobium sp. N-1-3-6]